MKKTILITGSTDGLGLDTAKRLAAEGHQVLLHGRNFAKLENAVKEVSKQTSEPVESYFADLSRMDEVEAFANAIIEKHAGIDVLINNAGILKSPVSITQGGLDIRFVVNTLAPCLLTKKLLPLLGVSGRVINLSSAAQSSVNLEALEGRVKSSDDLETYAQSKLAMTMWSRVLASSLKDHGPIIIAVNPGSLLATKMVQEGFGVAGNRIQIGTDVLIRAALSDEFASASGKYFDNDSGQFTSPHSDALDAQKTEKVMQAIESLVSEFMQPD